jgi:hypothetical protein
MVCRAIQNKSATPALPASADDEEAQLAAAIKASEDEHKQQEARRQAHAAAAAAAVPSGGKQAAVLADAELEAAMALSLAESALTDALARRDVADLEAAIALSLQLEQARLDEQLERALASPDPVSTPSPTVEAESKEVEAEKMAKTLLEKHNVDQARMARQLEEEKKRQQEVFSKLPISVSFIVLELAKSACFVLASGHGGEIARAQSIDRSLAPAPPRWQRTRAATGHCPVGTQGEINRKMDSGFCCAHASGRAGTTIGGGLQENQYTQRRGYVCVWWVYDYLNLHTPVFTSVFLFSFFFFFFFIYIWVV